MEQKEILKLLKEYKEKHNEKYGILSLGIFGSFARNEQNETSDIDIVVKTKIPDPFLIVHIKEELENELKRKIDIVRIRENMNQFLKENIDRESIYVWQEQIIGAIENIKISFSSIKSSDDFRNSISGLEKLNSICMLFIAIGESLKNIDKITNNSLLSNYKEIDWKGIKGFRDIISHHYFDIDADEVFFICSNHLDNLSKTIKIIVENIDSVENQT